MLLCYRNRYYIRLTDAFHSANTLDLTPTCSATKQNGMSSQAALLAKTNQKELSMSRQSGQTIGKNLQAGVLGGLIAAVINTIIFFIGQALNGGTLNVTTPQGTSLPLSAVLMFSIVPGVVAGALYYAFKRFSVQANRNFLILAAVVFILFIFPPFQAATDSISLITLQILHVGTALPILWALVFRKR